MRRTWSGSAAPIGGSGRGPAENDRSPYLKRRDLSWRGRLAEYVDRCEDPQQRILAVFDWLRVWFSEPGFRRCAWINGYGELGMSSPAVARQARRHKAAFRAYLQSLVTAAGLPQPVTDRLYLLAEGATVTAAIFTTAAPALQARSAAEDLLAVASPA